MFASFISALKISSLTANSSLSLSHPSWDLFIIIFFAIAVFIYGLSLGRDRNLLILLTTYISIALASSVPRLRLPRLGLVDLSRILDFKVAVFLFFFMVLFVVLSKSAVLRGLAHVGAGSLFQVLLYSFLHVGLLLSITLSLLPNEAKFSFAPLTQQIFTSDLGRFLWLFLPVVAMAALPPEKKRSVS